jgi:hypothetical protein
MPRRGFYGCNSQVDGALVLEWRCGCSRAIGEAFLTSYVVCFISGLLSLGDTGTLRDAEVGAAIEVRAAIEERTAIPNVRKSSIVVEAGLMDRCSYDRHQ